MNFEKELNEKQYEAVSTDLIHVRVIAGAGSGKTRVLTYRIAYLISELGVDPTQILAITFTNKVANEMRERVIKLVPGSARSLSIKTFHSFAAFFLRHEADVIGYPRSFTILDEEDQTKMIKDAAQSMGFKKSDPLVKKAISYIGSKKLKGLYPDEIKVENEFFSGEKDCLEIYRLYEEQKTKIYAFDFDDLLLKANYILENYMDIRTKWQNRYSHILIDEFQDTNDTEYKMISLLMKPSTSLYVVGDPDQTIYTWRGANQGIILNVNKEYSDAETVVLDRNYRSTQTILNSANKLIANNKLRIPKDLYTENNVGEPIVVKSCISSRGEADYVARQINILHNVNGYAYRDIVILYRSNYITQEFEQVFAMQQIPYKVYGGQKFYQRKEIKDLVAYFNLLVNTKDDLSFERIINVPRRGIGEATFATIKKEAFEHNQSIYEYLKDCEKETTEIPSRALMSLKSLIYTLDKARDNLKTEEVISKQVEDLISNIGYFEYLKQDEDGDDRIQNVNALVEDIRHFQKANPDAKFDEYLQNIALLSAQDEIIDGDYVTLMTVHTAKGLEFPVVFVVRVNEGVFPNQRALDDAGFKGKEEERRLFYVALTRAKERLFLSYTNDFSYVQQSTLIPSSFLKESGNAPKDNNEYRGGGGYPQRERKTYTFDDLQYDRYKQTVERESTKQNFAKATNGVASWNVGDIVIHKKLGRGVVVSLEGDDIIVVDFKEHGRKTILGSHPAVSKGDK